MSRSRRDDPAMWMVPLGVVTMAAVAVGSVAAGLPAGAAGTVTVVLLVAGAALWAVCLDRRIVDRRALVPALLGVGAAGVGLDVLQPSGPGFVVGYMALTGLALRLPRRPALLAGVPVLAGLGWAEARPAEHPLSAVLSVAAGAGFLFLAGAYAAVARDARAAAEALLAEEARTRAAVAEAAALAERSRLARELHDVLAHSLSGLTIRLEGVRLLAASTGADPRLVEQVTAAQHLAREGVAGARTAVEALRGHALPGPDRLGELVAAARADGVAATLEVVGPPARLRPEAALAVYRTVQEALTNVRRHAGRGARASVEVLWGDGEVEVAVTDDGGEASAGRAADLPSGGYGLTGLAERARALGGRASWGPAGDGFAVRVSLPTGDGAA